VTELATNSAKREQIRQALAARPEASNRELARQLGVDHKTVAAVRGEQTSPPPAEVSPPGELLDDDLVVEFVPGRIKARADLLITRGNVEYFLTAGSWLPAELAHLPRRAA
jgi:hypothetical protein